MKIKSIYYAVLTVIYVMMFVVRFSQGDEIRLGIMIMAVLIGVSWLFMKTNMDKWIDGFFEYYKKQLMKRTWLMVFLTVLMGVMIIPGVIFMTYLLGYLVMKK